jgi:phosphonate transport system substrate-binding protein
LAWPTPASASGSPRCWSARPAGTPASKPNSPTPSARPTPAKAPTLGRPRPARIGHRLGRRVELVVGTSFDQFELGQADLGVLCGLPYVWLAARQPSPVEPLAAPVLSGRRYGGRPVYYSDVIVRHDSPITRLEELRGRSWAYNEPASHSGATVTLYSLVRMGARPGFFTRVVEAGFHQRAIRLVHAGTVDAAAIDSQVLAIELRDHPQLADHLRVIGTFGPSTIQIRAMLATIQAAGWTSLTRGL